MSESVKVLIFVSKAPSANTLVSRNVLRIFGEY